MQDREERRRLLQSEIEKRLAERFAALRGELDRLRAEFEGRWAGFAARLAQGIDGIVPVELLANPEEPSAVGQVPAAAVRELDLAASQVELLNHLLEASRHYASRAILLVLRNDTWSVWKAAGFGTSGDPRPEEAVRKVTLTAAGEGPLARVRDGVPCRLGASNEVSGRLLCADAAEAVVVPMTIGEKVNGALYADAAAGKEVRFDPDAIAVLAFFAGLLIERLSARKFRPSPALRAFERELRPKTPEAGPREPPKPSSARVQPPATAQPSSPPASGVRRLTGPLAPDGDERHAAARRFAELLVSEIKLYNERAVKEGREQGNVYKRLKGEIDLSRQMYEQKFPEAARAGSDFLREELVRILADGHPEALGM